MATSQIANKLEALAGKLEADFERQQSKGSDCITLCGAEVEELLAAMYDGAADIDSLINGGP